MENINDVADFGATDVSSPNSDSIAELKSELAAANREAMVAEHNFINARASLRVAEATLDEYSFAGSLTDFMAIMETNMHSCDVLMGPVLVAYLKDLHKLLSGTSTRKLRLMMNAIVKSGENKRQISYKRGGAWPLGVERLPFKKLSKRKQVALVAWLYICPDYPSLDVTQLHLLQDCLRDKFRTRVLHCVNSIRKLFDSDGWY